jgi:hypothetical protein
MFLKQQNFTISDYNFLKRICVSLNELRSKKPMKTTPCMYASQISRISLIHDDDTGSGNPKNVPTMRTRLTWTNRGKIVSIACKSFVKRDKILPTGVVSENLVDKRKTRVKQMAALGDKMAAFTPASHTFLVFSACWQILVA